jgi:hypothetical protein
MGIMLIDTQQLEWSNQYAVVGGRYMYKYGPVGIARWWM